MPERGHIESQILFKMLLWDPKIGHVDTKSQIQWHFPWRKWGKYVFLLQFFKGELIPKMYYINVSLWYQSLVDHFLSDSHLRPQRTIPEKGTGIKNCILNFQEQEWETGIPNSHSQLLGMGMKKPFPIFGRLVFPKRKILTPLPYYQQINTGPEVILCLKF